MKRFMLLGASLSLALSALSAIPARAEFGPGDRLPTLELRDQHEQAQTIPDGTRILLFAPDRAAGELVTEALEDQDADSLAARDIRYLADISGMPGIITSLFALPKLRERPYPILLGEEAEQTQDWPRREDQVTWLRLEDGRIDEVRYFDSAAALREALGLGDNEP